MMETGLILALAFGVLIGGHQIVIALKRKERLSGSELQALKVYYEAILGVNLVITDLKGLGESEVDEELLRERISAWNAEYMIRI